MTWPLSITNILSAATMVESLQKAGHITKNILKMRKKHKLKIFTYELSRWQFFVHIDYLLMQK